MLVKVAFRNLFRNIRRSMAILCTVAFGSTALLLFQGFIAGVLGQFKENSIHTQFGHAQITTTGYRETRFADPSKYWIEDYVTLEDSLRKEEKISQLFPRTSFGALLKHGGASVSGYGQGIDANEERTFFHSLNFIEGQNLSTEPNGIILGKGLAEALNVHVGERVQLYVQPPKGGYSKATVHVVGIFHTGSSEFDGQSFRIQLPQAQKLLKTQKIEQVTLGLDDEKSFPLIKKDIEEAFPGLEVTYFEDLDTIYYKHSVDWLNSQYTIVQAIIVSIVLLGIFNTISSSILERRQEVGNLRANGESKWDIISLVLFEGVFLGIGGLLAGTLVAVAVASAVFAGGVMMPPGPGSTRQFAVQFAFHIPMLLQTIALSLVACLGASFLAARKVVSSSISESLNK